MIAIFCGPMLGSAFAGTQEWTSGWGMGVNEYQISDSNGNELAIYCPDDKATGVMSAVALVNGKKYSSKGSGTEQFDIIVDGELYSNPFYTDCRACDANFPAFWEAFRAANELAISASGETISLPTTKLNELLHPYENVLNSCKSDW